MISSTNNEKIIADFQKKVDSFGIQKQLTFEEKKELVFKGNDSLKRPSYNLCSITNDNYRRFPIYRFS